MAAPTKARLEYYARDIGLELDRKFRRPRLQHGAVVVLVWAEVLVWAAVLEWAEGRVWAVEVLVWAVVLMSVKVLV